MKTGYTVHDCMTTKPISIKPDASIQQCSKEMKDSHVGAIVVKSGNESLGLVTEQDIVRKVVADGKDASKMKVTDLMEKNLHTISPEDDIYDALIKMRDHNIRHLPVIENGKMVGLLTLKDILKIEPSLFELLVEKFNLREESRKPINRLIAKEGICQGCGTYVENIKQTKSGSLLCYRCAKEQA